MFLHLPIRTLELSFRRVFCASRRRSGLYFRTGFGYPGPENPARHSELRHAVRRVGKHGQRWSAIILDVWRRESGVALGAIGMKLAPTASNRCPHVAKESAFRDSKVGAPA